MSRIHRSAKVVMALAVCAGLLASCSSSGGGCKSGGSSSGGGGGASGNAVDVKNFSFNPSSLSVAKGTKVTWTFDDAAKHNVTDSKNAFKSSDLSGGGTYSFTFNTAGTYSYICTIHPYMKGTVTVK